MYISRGVKFLPRQRRIKSPAIILDAEVSPTIANELLKYHICVIESLKPGKWRNFTPESRQNFKAVCDIVVREILLSSQTLLFSRAIRQRAERRARGTLEILIPPKQIILERA